MARTSHLGVSVIRRTADTGPVTVSSPLSSRSPGDRRTQDSAVRSSMSIWSRSGTGVMLRDPELWLQLELRLTLILNDNRGQRQEISDKALYNALGKDHSWPDFFTTAMAFSLDIIWNSWEKEIQIDSVKYQVHRTWNLVEIR